MTEKSEKTSIIREARQIVLKPRTKHHVTVTTKACEIKIAEVQTSSTRRQRILAARGIINISPKQPFYILFSNVSDRDVRLSKHLKTAETAEPINVIHAIDTNGRKAFPIETLETRTNVILNAPVGHINMHAFQHTDMSAIHYKDAKY